MRWVTSTYGIGEKEHESNESHASLTENKERWILDHPTKPTCEGVCFDGQTHHA